MKNENKNYKDHPDNKAERAEVLLALALEHREAEEQCASMEELAAWHQKKLSSSRHQEILSHLADCDHCYGLWSEMAELSLEPEMITEPLATRTKESKILLTILKKLANLLPGPGLGMPARVFTMAATTALVVMILLPFYKGGPSSTISGGLSDLAKIHGASGPAEIWPGPTRTDLLSKDLDLGGSPQGQAMIPTEQQAFAAGIRDALERIAPQTDYWHQRIQALPEERGTCPDGPDLKRCKELQPHLFQAGRQSVLLYFSCQVQGSVKIDFWEDQKKTMIDLADSLSDLQGQDRFTYFYEDWRDSVLPGTDSSSVLCGRASSLLELGLY